MLHYTKIDLQENPMSIDNNISPPGEVDPLAAEPIKESGLPAIIVDAVYAGRFRIVSDGGRRDALRSGLPEDARPYVGPVFVSEPVQPAQPSNGNEPEGPKI